MSAFEDVLDEYLGEDGDTGDVRAVVRRLWLYDFEGAPQRLWQGQGKLYTTGGVEWLGTIDAGGVDHHRVPSISDGRDGSSKRLEFSLPYLDAATYAALKADSSMVNGRTITCYIAVFQVGEGLRPETPIDFFGQYTMQSPVFDESLSLEGGAFVKRYRVTVIAKDGNAGRSRAHRGSYSPTSQLKRARLLTGDPDFIDKGCDFVPELANKTLQIP